MVVVVGAAVVVVVGGRVVTVVDGPTPVVVVVVVVVTPAVGDEPSRKPSISEIAPNTSIATTTMTNPMIARSRKKGVRLEEA